MNDRATQSRQAAGERTYGGFRVALNRIFWRTYIFGAGSLVVGTETLRPNRGHGGRVFHVASNVLHRFIGVPMDVIGLERLSPNQGYVFAPNHRSHLDNTALLAALPAGVRFAAKRELFNEPVLGRALRAAGMIPIDRKDPELAKRTLDRATAKLGKAVSVVIFPEGTRAPQGEMLPFKSGAFVIAIQQQVPIVPIALHNTGYAMPARGYLTILGGRIVVEVLPPIPTTGLTSEDLPRLKEQVLAVLANALRPEDGGSAQRSDLGFAAGMSARVGNGSTGIDASS
jgi:1-acyl-sn-glycerol-3-phosphate acyltransferase